MMSGVVSGFQWAIVTASGPRLAKETPYDQDPDFDSTSKNIIALEACEPSSLSAIPQAVSQIEE